MPPSRKRGKTHQSPISSRPKKKHKRLDAIHDKPIPSPPPPLNSSEDDAGAGVGGFGDPGQLRRSSRARRAPDVLDSSPVPSNRHTKKNHPKPPSVLISPMRNDEKEANIKEEEEEEQEGRRKKKKQKKKSVSVSRPLSFEDEEEGWRLRLRSRGDGGKTKDRVPVRVSRKGEIGRRKRKLDSDLVKIDGEEGEEEEDEKVAFFDLNVVENKAEDAEAEEEAGDGDDVSSFDEKELETSVKAVETIEEEEEEEDDDDGDKAASLDEMELENSVKTVEAREEEEEEEELEIYKQAAETREEVEADGEMEELDTKTDENANINDAVIENYVKEGDMASPVLGDKISGSLRMKEGRRCGLCGRGMDGKPPKKLVKESIDSDKEAYEGSSASEEPNYDIWDGFGDEPGWLGRLLGPIHDRFGIARVWVHQHCAVWSPEVYFAGLGCLKNVRAALCRGRALKCSRCGRPGATIGCRVDRCPKTYHLPCSRADGCIFDHRKFLIACNDHRRLFQPQGFSYSQQIRKRKARKLKLEIRKLSNEAYRKDLEAEEKWLEHCGEDEEFLKREGKRLHRDILRIAPTYIGGYSENEKLYQGWASVAGLQGVIQCMKEVVILPLLYPDFFSNMSITPPRGVLLHGYPGTGKTLVVRALIGACSRGDKRIAYFARKGADCLGKYVGDAERQLRLLFQVAEKSQPSIIFFDEIDGLAPVRSRNQDQTHSSVVSTLLSLMDGLKSRGSVVVIGATNRPEAIDPALRRPGRFDREIYFPLPSEKDRSVILALHTQSWPKPLSGTLLSWIANQTIGYAGADLQALCTQAAMNALKRNFALKELLSSAEKGSIYGKLPSLPSLTVEERDWLAALELAPPPCSRREAGMAANDVVSSPLPSHLIPCLLQPLSRLLISFCNDERIWLPPALSKAAKCTRHIINSSLEQRGLPTASWWIHLYHLLQEKCIWKEMEENLSHCGLIRAPSVGGNSFVSDNNDDQEHDSFTLRHFGMNRRKSMKMFSLKSDSLSGFRVLISGSPRSGQQHLASCLLHGFMGHVDIQKVNLATISQRGHGDLLRGLTQILSRCLNLERCIVYMPRIDLWAVNEDLGEDAEGSPTATITCKSLPTNRKAKSVTEIWNSFVEQVDSASTSASLIILATCELQNHDLPSGIKQFFTSDVLHVDSATHEHTIPRFSAHINGNFNPDLVIDSFAARLSDDLARYFVQVLHQRTHLCGSQDNTTVCDAVEGDSEGQRKGISNGLTDTTAYSGPTTFNTRASCNGNQNQQDANTGLSSVLGGHQEAGIHPSSHQDLFPKILPSKATMGNSTSAIVTFGYQILRYPQFAELCWVTSKLREGPCVGINGPWKGWPFNACVMHGIGSTNKVSGGGNYNIHKEKDNSGVVRGLTAVGLLSYRGVYASVKEVAIEVRKVLEILVGQIRAKLLARKDRYQYLRILSQAAYLEDMVNCWAYKFESSHTSNSSTESHIKPGSEGRLPTENNLSCNYLSGSQSGVPNIVIKSCTEAQETLLTANPAEPIISNGQCIDLNHGLSNNTLLNSDTRIIPETEHLQEDVPSAPLPPTLHSSPVSLTMVDEDESCRTEDPKLNKSLDSLKQSNGLEMKRSSTAFADLNVSINGSKSGIKDVRFSSDDPKTVLSSEDVELISGKPCKVGDLTLREDGKILATSKIYCLYNCCSGCLHALYVLARDIVSQCWDSHAHCSTIDDINNVISTCSLNILASFRKYIMSECSNNLGELHHAQSEHCACWEVGNKQFKQMPCQNKTSKNLFLAADCSCHEGNVTAHTESDSPFRQALTYFFRDGVLVSSGPQKDDVPHCRFDKFCLCSVVEMILAIRRPL